MGEYNMGNKIAGSSTCQPFWRYALILQISNPHKFIADLTDIGYTVECTILIAYMKRLYNIFCMHSLRVRVLLS